MGELVKIESLFKSFLLGGKTIEVLKGIDLTIEKGEMLSIVGASGVGKSTFLHVMGTLDAPTSGSIIFEGENVFALAEQKLAAFRNRSIGFVFQFHHLLPDFSAIENVMMPGRIAGLPGDEALRRAARLLEAVGLSGRLSHRPGELSGGEQQRVAVARALIMEPKLLLADEPTGNLDGPTGRSVQDVLVELNRSMGVTFVVVTHNVELAGRMPRRLRMEDGRIFDA